MDDHTIKVLIAWNVINQIKDKSIQNIVRSILFNPDNNINWSHALEQLKINMPELNL
jgi:hypothetical protein